MTHIDLFGTNARSVRKYEDLVSTINTTGMVLADFEGLIRNYKDDGAFNSLRYVEKGELKRAHLEAVEALAGLKRATIRQEAELKTWDWQL
ncbi:hypothetical protein [Haloglycomyces albus]|uniref:hypothetical protein n=1 Tax=Haloglycomyces albus TaxID=526067 RepID=UPI00046CFA66|nr:hypothetical protein [Haloglycomyces albus]